MSRTLHFQLRWQLKPALDQRVERYTRPGTCMPDFQFPYENGAAAACGIGVRNSEDATEIRESERMKHIRDATDRWLHVKRRTPRASSDSAASRRLHRLPAVPAAVSRQSSLARCHTASLSSPTVVARPRVERPSRRSASRAEEGIRVAAAPSPPPLPWLACIVRRREEKTKTKERRERRALELWPAKRGGKEKKGKKEKGKKIEKKEKYRKKK
jgi:hypothetical protein